MSGWLRLVPVGAGGLGMAIPALLLLANLLWGLTDPARVPWQIGPPLDGVAPQTRPVLNARTLLGGTFQHDAALAVGPLVPVQRLAVRVKNQVWYDLLGAPGNPALVVSRGQTLIELAYLREFCARNEAAFRSDAAAWLPRLRAMQDAVQRQGQTFLYVLTPSKVSFDPALVPAGYPCRADAAARSGLVAVWRRMLDGAGIQYVDTTAIIRDARPDYPFPLYAKGGTHWNMVGAALAAQAVGARLDALRGGDPFPPFTFDWTVTRDPVYPDDDLLLLMNLLWPDSHYPVPLVTFHPGPQAGACRPVRVAIVGGSFMHGLAQVLSTAACPPQLDEWEYWQVLHVVWPRPGALYDILPVDPAARRADLLGAEVVIYEENEQNMARTNHGPALLAFLDGR